MAFKMKGSPMQRNFGIGKDSYKMPIFSPDGKTVLGALNEMNKPDPKDKELKTGGSTVADVVSTDKKSKKRKRKNK
jgi:hypothetical protein